MNRTAVILIILMLLIGLAGGFFLRPVVIKQVDTTVEDSLRFEAQKWEGIARDYELEADQWRARYDSLAQVRPVYITKYLPNVRREIHAAGLDAIRDTLLHRPK
jgi:hypothetical protein